MEAVKALLSGVSFNYAKPILATEVRRILPTAAGFPMELSLYTSAVAASAVQGRQKQENIKTYSSVIEGLFL